jgi:hypothetical protein
MDFRTDALDKADAFACAHMRLVAARQLGL